LIHIGFELGEHTDPNFGPIWFYSTNTNQAQVITAMHGTQAQFINDDPSQTPHTASGLGTGPFPASFDNVNGFNKQSGTTIDGSLTWSSGSLSFGQKSQVFTVGPPGHYYFGCNYHYTVPPTQNNQSMGDVLVST
jgi:plastocyanin